MAGQRGKSKSENMKRAKDAFKVFYSGLQTFKTTEGDTSNITPQHIYASVNVNIYIHGVWEHTTTFTHSCWTRSLRGRNHQLTH